MFELTVHGEQRLYAALDRLSEVASDVREAPDGWQPHVDIRLDFQRRHMDTEGAGGWQPLGEGYAAWKQRQVGDKPILQFSGRMYRSLTEEGAANYVRIEEAQKLSVGTNDPKARYHHTGAGNLAEREVMKATDEEARAHVEAFHDSFTATTRALGFQVI